MKTKLIGSFLALTFLVCAVFAQTYTGTTVPQQNDVAVDSQRKINKVLVGSLHLNSAQVAASTSAQNIAARDVRRGIVIRNLDASITIYLSGSGLVTSSNGMPLKAGESIAIDTAATIYYIAASGTPTIAYLETYDGP